MARVGHAILYGHDAWCCDRIFSFLFSSGSCVTFAPIVFIIITIFVIILVIITIMESVLLWKIKKNE